MNKIGTTPIETERLLLRRFTLSDADAMFCNWASDSEVTRFLTWPTHQSVETTKMIISGWIKAYEDGTNFNWAIEERETGTLIGNIAAVEHDEATDTAVIGYCMSKNYWGRGIMPETLKAVMNYLFNEVGVNRIAAYHDVNNPKSGRVMQKAGMNFETILPQGGRNNQGIYDKACYGITKEEWLNRE